MKRHSDWEDIIIIYRKQCETIRCHELQSREETQTNIDYETTSDSEASAPRIDGITEAKDKERGG